MTALKRKAKTSPGTQGTHSGEYLHSAYLLTRAEMKAQLAGHGWNHYVYGLCTAAGLVFYIGKGTGMRALQHERDAAEGESSFKSRIIRACGDGLRYTVLTCCADDRYAAGLEAMLLIDNLDCLANIAAGSEVALRRMWEGADPFVEALASLARTAEILDDMEIETERAARALAARCPWLMPDLYPQECGEMA